MLNNHPHKLSQKPLYLLVILPVNALNQACLNGFFDTIFRATFRKNDRGFFCLFVKSKYVRTDFQTDLTPNTLFSLANHIFSYWAATAKDLGMHRSNLHHLATHLGLRKKANKRPV